MKSMEDIFGPVISSYSRAQAHNDGVLVDVTSDETRRLYKFPVSITAGLRAALSKGAGSDPATFAARLWDVLYMGSVASRVHRDAGSDLFYSVKVGCEVVSIWANCGPSDNAEPVMTFGFPEDR